jgi:hypothetical protein
MTRTTITAGGVQGLNEAQTVPSITIEVIWLLTESLVLFRKGTLRR